MNSLLNNTFFKKVISVARHLSIEPGISPAEQTDITAKVAGSSSTTSVSSPVSHLHIASYQFKISYESMIIGGLPVVIIKPASLFTAKIKQAIAILEQPRSPSKERARHTLEGAQDTLEQIVRTFKPWAFEQNKKAPFCFFDPLFSALLQSIKHALFIECFSLEKPETATDSALKENTPFQNEAWRKKTLQTLAQTETEMRDTLFSIIKTRTSPPFMIAKSAKQIHEFHASDEDNLSKLCRNYLKACIEFLSKQHPSSSNFSVHKKHMLEISLMYSGIFSASRNPYTIKQLVSYHTLVTQELLKTKLPSPDSITPCWANLIETIYKNVSIYPVTSRLFLNKLHMHMLKHSSKIEILPSEKQESWEKINKIWKKFATIMDEIKIPYPARLTDPITPLFDEAFKLDEALKKEEAPDADQDAVFALMPSFESLCFDFGNISISDHNGYKLEIGKNKYIIGPKLEGGASGNVYHGKHTGTNQKVAIKIIPISEEEMFDNTINEATIHAKLKHPNVIRLLDFGINDTDYFLVMELGDACIIDTINDTKKAVDIGGNKTPKINGAQIRYTLAIIRQMVAAAKFINSKGVFHGDWKLDNMMEKNMGEKGGLANRLKAIDFGLSKFIHAFDGKDDNAFVQYIRDGLIQRYYEPFGTFGFVQGNIQFASKNAGKLDSFSLGCSILNFLGILTVTEKDCNIPRGPLTDAARSSYLTQAANSNIEIAKETQEKIRRINIPELLPLIELIEQTMIKNKAIEEINVELPVEPTLS